MPNPSFIFLYLVHFLSIGLSTFVHSRTSAACGSLARW